MFFGLVRFSMHDVDKKVDANSSHMASLKSVKLALALDLILQHDTQMLSHHSIMIWMICFLFWVDHCVNLSPHVCVLFPCWVIRLGGFHHRTILIKNSSRFGTVMLSGWQLCNAGRSLALRTDPLPRLNGCYGVTGAHPMLASLGHFFCAGNGTGWVSCNGVSIF